MTNQIEAINERKIKRPIGAILIVLAQIYMLGYLILPYIITALDKIFIKSSNNSSFARIISLLRSEYFGDASVFKSILSALPIACLITFSVLIIIKKAHPLVSIPLFANALLLIIRYSISVVDNIKFYSDYYKKLGMSLIESASLPSIIITALIYAIEISSIIILAALVLYSLGKLRKKPIATVLLILTLVPVAVLCILFLFTLLILSANTVMSFMQLLGSSNPDLTKTQIVYYSIMTASSVASIILYIGYAFVGIWAFNPCQKVKATKIANNITIEGDPVNTNPQTIDKPVEVTFEVDEAPIEEIVENVVDEATEEALEKMVENPSPVEPSPIEISPVEPSPVEPSPEIKRSSLSNEFEAADALVRFKYLLDTGVITQEDYDAKKKQLLGL